MPRVGNYCLTMVGDGVADADVAQGAGLAATSSNAQHAVKNAADGDAQSYWASGSDPAGPVDLQLTKSHSCVDNRYILIFHVLKIISCCCYL